MAMPTFMQVVERLRERGRAPVNGRVCMRNLARELEPSRATCMRPLISKALEGVAQKRPWAVILCRYKDQPQNPAAEQPIKDFFRRAFSQGAGGMIDYWRDVSLGAIDLRDSVIFGWVVL